MTSPNPIETIRHEAQKIAPMGLENLQPASDMLDYIPSPKTGLKIGLMTLAATTALGLAIEKGTQKAGAVMKDNLCNNPAAQLYPPFVQPDVYKPLSPGVDLKVYSNGLGEQGNTSMCTGSDRKGVVGFTIINYGDTAVAEPINLRIKKSAESQMAIKSVKANIGEVLSCIDDPIDSTTASCTFTKGIDSRGFVILHSDVSAYKPAQSQQIQLEASTSQADPTPEDNVATVAFDVSGEETIPLNSTPRGPFFVRPLNKNTKRISKYCWMTPLNILPGYPDNESVSGRVVINSLHRSAPKSKSNTRRGITVTPESRGKIIRVPLYACTNKLPVFRGTAINFDRKYQTATQSNLSLPLQEVYAKFSLKNIRGGNKKPIWRISENTNLTAYWPQAN